MQARKRGQDVQVLAGRSLFRLRVLCRVRSSCDYPVPVSAPTHSPYLRRRRVQILDASTAVVVVDIPLKSAIDISFSPKGTHLSTWERPGSCLPFPPAHVTRLCLTRSGIPTALEPTPDPYTSELVQSRRRKANRDTRISRCGTLRPEKSSQGGRRRVSMAGASICVY